MADGGSALVPRHDMDAEAACLCAALLDEGCALELIDLIQKADDFYADANRRVFEVIRDLARDGRKIDIVSVAGELRVKGRLEQIGGTAYLAQLADATPAIAHLAEHARIIRDLGRVRRLTSKLKMIAAQAHEVPVGEIGMFIQETETQVYLATADTAANNDTSRSYRDAANETYQAIVEAYRNPEKRLQNERSTGFPGIDDHIGGMSGGDVVVVGGRPGQGKSALVQQIAEATAAGRWAVIHLSPEMKWKQLMYRSLGRQSGDTALQLRRGNPADWTTLTDAVASRAELPIVMDHEPYLTPMRARAKIKRHYSALRRDFPGIGLGLVVVDYLQLMRSDFKTGTRTEEIAEITRSFKVFAMEYDVPVILLSQLKRADKKGQRIPPRPTMDDLRESGAIEQDADVILMVHREDQYREPHEDKTGDAELLILKCRNSSGEGMHRLLWDGPGTAFRDTVGQQQNMGFG